MKLARAAVIVIGIVLAAAGGVVAYRAAFIEPRTAAVVISEEGVREMPSTPRIVGGVALLLVGAGLAVFGARRR